MLLKIILFLLLISNSACSQNSSEKIPGEWTLEISNDGDWYPDVIIFRSDYKYLVFNDMDFVGMPGTSTEFDIIMDNQTATALTETGKWIYDKAGNQIILADRNFIKENSLFNKYYGKGEKLILKVKKITEKKVVLCYNGNQCDTYIRNYNPRGDPDLIFYRELTKEFSGTGSQCKEILLSGYETELKLSYDFYENADQLIIEDKSGKELFSTKMTATNGRRTKELPLRGITKLVFKVTSSQESSKWKIKAEIK